MLGHRLVRTTADEAKKKVCIWFRQPYNLNRERYRLSKKGVGPLFAWGTQTQDQRFLNWDRQIQCNGKGSDSGLMGDLARII
jgi:hypothetical protein